MNSLGGGQLERPAGRARPAARGRFRPSLEPLEERSLPSASPLTSIHPGNFLVPHAVTPSAGVVELEVIYPDNQVALGTGAMLDSTHVLTAGHVLYSARDGGYAKDVFVLSSTSDYQPAWALPRNGGLSLPSGALVGSYERVDPSWISFSASNPGATSPTVNDIGLVTLAAPLATRSFTLGSTTFANGALFQTAGFNPGAGRSPLTALGTVSGDGVDFTQSGSPAVPGQSGSPIYQTSSTGTPILYAVLTGADGFLPSSKVYGTRITPALAAEIQGWEKADQTLGIPAPHPGAGPVTLQHPAVTTTPLQRPAPASSTVYALDYYWRYNYPNYSQFYGPTYNGYSYVSPWGSTVQSQTDYFTPNDYMRYDQYQNAPYVYQYYETQSQPWYDLWEDPAW
jgi:hypothetical protein